MEVGIKFIKVFRNSLIFLLMLYIDFEIAEHQMDINFWFTDMLISGYVE